MGERTIIEEIVDIFKDKTKEHSKNLGAEGYNTETYYIKNDIEKGYNFIDAALEFKDFFLKMEYKVNTSMLLPKSTLEMRILFKGGKFPIEYSIYDLLNIIDETNFNCYTIPYIATVETMQKGLDYLVDAFVKYKGRIEELFHNDIEFKKLEENVREQISNIIGGNVFKSINIEYIAHMLEVYYLLDTARFTTDVYANYVIFGKYNKAIKAYSKSRYKMTLYEKRLREYLLTLKETVSFLPDELQTFEQVKKHQKVGIKQILLTGLSFLVLSPMWSIIYGIIYIATHIYVTKGTLYASNSEWSICIMLGMTTAAINMFFIRKLIAKWIHKKKYEEYQKIETLLSNESTNNFMTKLLQFVIAGSLVLSMLAANTYIGFENNNLVLKDDYFNLKGNYIEYEKIDSIYKVDKISDDFLGEIENTNYVIVLKDNTKIELFWFIEANEVEEYILPILKEKEIEIKHIDLITNIPGVGEIKQDENID